MSPQQLTDAANTLTASSQALPTPGQGHAHRRNQPHGLGHVTSDSDADQSREDGGECGSDSDQMSGDDKNLSKDAALRLLAKARKSEPTVVTTTSEAEAPPKRPRLARQSEFMEWDDGTPPPDSPGGRRVVTSLQRGGRNRRRQLDSSDEDSEDEGVVMGVSSDVTGIGKDCGDDESPTDEERPMT